MDSIRFEVATLKDAEDAAKLFVTEKNISWEEAVETFRDEFSYCLKHPDQRIYFLAKNAKGLLSYAGTRHYDLNVDENMYGTESSLPTGWYLRGLKVHPEWRRLGLGKEMTLKRLEWLRNKTLHCFVFLDDENKITLPMYFDLGFKEVSRGWTFSDPQRKLKGTQGILLRSDF